MERTGEALQTILTESAQGHRYYSNMLEAYQTLVYWPSVHFPTPNKSQTYSAEADEAELRHYLARLARR
ncbi:MAG: hypothetical protein J5I90_08355 [Caldilineales bacterium]|nr:hypothetical protein [Caldilineales bacterium]